MTAGNITVRNITEKNTLVNGTKDRHAPDCVSGTELLHELIEARKTVKEKRPLIHGMTGAVAINDCANVVLALGASPIMAEHPDEVEDITGHAAGLAVSLANITEARMCAIMRSGAAAYNNHIPSVIDVVGVTCSSMRMKFARQFISECRPSVIKGNISEIKAMAGAAYNSVGVDVSSSDAVGSSDEEKLHGAAEIIKGYAKETSSVVIASGEVDIISDGDRVYYIENGVPAMAKVTGTGCMLNVITAVYLSAAAPLTASILAAVTLGISGELADSSKGLGTYHMSLIDSLSMLSDEDIEKKSRILVTFS